MSPSRGVVYLVGAGPGDPELVTVKGLRLLRQADVVLYDRLIPTELLAVCQPDATLIDVGKTPRQKCIRQDEINALLVEHATAGRTVVRLKGGDPFVFGRGGEELEACRTAGIHCVIIPGISSATAVPAVAGIPITQRATARSVAIVTGHAQRGDLLPDYDFEALAALDTLVLLMGRSNLSDFAAALIDAGRSPDTPAASVASGTLPQQQTVVATLATIADAIDDAALSAPVTTIIGETAAWAAQHEAWNEQLRAQQPLAGRRIALTHASAAGSSLRAGLIRAGAHVIEFPMIAIHHADDAPDVVAAIEQLDTFDWLVFTSVNGVRGFFHYLQQSGRDARALAGVRIAVVGPGTGHALVERQLTPDFTPQTHTAEGLLAELAAREDLAGQRMLFPHGNLALGTLPAGLRRARAEVTTAVVYQTRPAVPSEANRRIIEAGVDALLFCSPSGVMRFGSLGIKLPPTTIGCIGPTTATAARRLGFDVDVVPQRPGSPGLLAALADHFREEVAPPQHDGDDVDASTVDSSR